MDVYYAYRHATGGTEGTEFTCRNHGIIAKPWAADWLGSKRNPKQHYDIALGSLFIVHVGKLEFTYEGKKD